MSLFKGEFGIPHVSVIEKRVLDKSNAGAWKWQFIQLIPGLVQAEMSQVTLP